MDLDPRDDRPHLPVDDDGWRATWGFELSRDGLHGFVRLTLLPAQRVASWWTLVDGPDFGLIVVRDVAVPPPRRPESMEIRGDGLWAELVCETPFEHWGISLEAFGLRVDDADDEIGDRLPVGLDLEWELTAPPHVVEADAGTHVTQVGTIHGELLIGDDRIAIDTPATRDHAWGLIPPHEWPPPH